MLPDKNLRAGCLFLIIGSVLLWSLIIAFIRWVIN